MGASGTRLTEIRETPPGFALANLGAQGRAANSGREGSAWSADLYTGFTGCRSKQCAVYSIGSNAGAGLGREYASEWDTQGRGLLADLYDSVR